MAMKLLEYLYYRMYKAYSEKNDSPIFRVFMYITFFELLIVGVLIIFIGKLLTMWDILSEGYLYRIKQSYGFWGVIIFSIFLFTYLTLMRKSYSYYSDKFSQCSLNKYIKVWMLIVFPFLFFFLSIHAYILLFGGTVLGKEVTGIISK